jgi:hypothetical protein
VAIGQGNDISSGIGIDSHDHRSGIHSRLELRCAQFYAEQERRGNLSDRLEVQALVVSR